MKKTDPSTPTPYEGKDILDLSFVSLKTSLLVCGANVGMNIDPAKRTGMQVQFDRKNRVVLVWFMGKLEIVPMENVAKMTPFKMEEWSYSKPKAQVKPVGPVEASQPNQAITAQVSTPHDHVFANAPGLTKS